ncbi:MAG: hypothetical protein QG656_47, partial [Candidatus Hydrogenedentes bacterium]|nr:hypothetical protein [Candidatus Hydrogenedentota bacterium]
MCWSLIVVDLLMSSCLIPSSAVLGAGVVEQPTDRSIFLWPEGKAPAQAADNDFRPWLEPYLVETGEPRGAVIVCPGGGYSGRAGHEGSPIAQMYNEAGLNAFVLQYRVSPNRHPAPISDAARAVRIVRERAAEWNVKPDHIAILGFSAGGHLTASLGVHFADVKYDGDDSAVSCRPDALVLCYAVISSGKFGHRGSMENLLGPNPT